MSNQVIKVSKTELEKIKAAYQPYFLNKNVPYTEFVAKKNGLTITAYTSGKVMFQGSQAEQEAQQWQGSTSPTKSATPSKNNTTSLPANFAQLSIIGSDEVGNGSYFGPLIVCAVYAEKAVLELLKTLGVKDSKMLTDAQIRELAPQIKACVPFQLLTVSPKKYNQIQPTFIRTAL